MTSCRLTGFSTNEMLLVRFSMFVMSRPKVLPVRSSRGRPSGTRKVVLEVMKFSNVFILTNY